MRQIVYFGIVIVIVVVGIFMSGATGYAQQENPQATVAPVAPQSARSVNPYHLKKAVVGTNFVLGLLENQTLVTWGSNRFWQTTIPYRYKDTLFTDIAAGNHTSYALDTTGQVVAWAAPIDCPSCVDGQNVVPVDAQSGVVAIAAGGSNALAIKSDGSIVIWGSNLYGQLNVPADATNVTQAAIGSGHVVVVKSDGTVVSWGRNNFGQTSVPPGLTGVTAVATGSYHSIALMSNGRAVAWGSNLYGESKMPGFNTIVQIAAGYNFSAVRLSNGNVWSWGDNSDGNVGSLRQARNAKVIGAAYVNSVVGYNNGVIKAYGSNVFNPLITRTHTTTPFYSPTRTPSNTRTASRTRTSSPTDTPTESDTPTETETPTETDTPTPTNTKTYTPSKTHTRSMTYTVTETETPSETPTETETPTDTETPTETETNTPTYTNTSTITLTPSITPTDTPLPYLKNGGFESGVTYWSTVTSIVDLGVTALGGNPGDTNRCVTVDTQDYAGIYTRPSAYDLGGPSGFVNVSPLWAWTNYSSRGPKPTNDNTVWTLSSGQSITVQTVSLIGTNNLPPTEGTKAIKLTLGRGSSATGFHVKHGPAIYSNYFRALTGQVITLDWYAQFADDDAAVLGYLLDADVDNDGIPAENAADCAQYELLDTTVTGVSGWQNAYVTVPAVKDFYSFVFVGGTYDKTGGTVSGAGFWIDNISQGQPQVITFAPAPLDNAYNYSASYVSSPVDTLPGVTGFATATSGFPVQYSSNTPSVCTVSSRYTINFVGSGTCTLTASQPGGVDNAGTLWASAPMVQGSFIVSNQMYTVTPSNTPTLTRTPSNTRTATRTFTNTRTNTPTDTATDTATPTATNTATNTRTFTRTRTNTWTPSSTRTRSNTPTNTETDTPTETDTNTPTDTSTPTKTFTRTNTATRTLSPSRTFTPVPNQDTLKKVSVGNSYVLGLLNDDTLVMWGDNRHGQTTIPFALRTMRFDDVATGHTSAYALGIDGRVYAWGSNDFGEGSVPLAAQSNVKAIAAGGRVAAAVRTDGTVVLWGLMVHGQRTIPRGLNRVIDVAVGYRHIIALRDDGTVVCWGESKSCGAIPTDLRDVVKVAASDGYSLALKDDGTVVAFGMNLFGELNVPRTATDIAQIGAGQGFAVALKNDGTLVGWGRATTGAISFPPALNDAVLVSAANVNTVIMRRNGEVQSFGLPLFNALVSRTRTRTPIITLTPSLPRAISTLTPSNTKTASPTPTLTRSIVPTRTR